MSFEIHTSQQDVPKYWLHFINAACFTVSLFILPTQHFLQFRRVFCHDNFDYWFFTICSDILFIYLWCRFSLIFHVSFSLPASSYLNPSTLYPGKVSKMCVSHQWFPFLWCQFLSLLYLVYFYLSDGSLVSSWYLISYLPLFLCQSFALLTLFNVS